MNLSSEVFDSNVFTKGVAVKYDPRQAIPKEPYTIPNEATRLLLAKLVFEEAQETVRALGCVLSQTNDGPLEVVIETSDDDVRRNPESPFALSMEDIIDGACDVIYVATGLLVACGVPDLPHLAEVCRANNSKFPGGVAVIDSCTGKYLKPEGWQPPNHKKVEERLKEIEG